LSLVEACEYRENFLKLKPAVAALLNVEPDHFDYYRSREALHSAFAKFVDGVPADGIVLASTACRTAMGIAIASGRRVVTFGVSADADWQAANLEQTRGRYRFDLMSGGKRQTRVMLSVAGRHNVLNALAAAALARQGGAPVEQIGRGLNAFRGLKRRMQARWTLGGVTWVDDYAHHPTEVAASLAALREMFPGRRLVCVFQPHQASRLGALLDEFAASLHNADRVAVAEVVRAREGLPKSGEPTAGDLAAAVWKMGVDTMDEHRPEIIADQLADDLEPGDVLVTMGAGDLDKYFHNFHQRFRRDRAAA
jgi:UDP-N-acetylmuramate--alanine ligase